MPDRHGWQPFWATPDAFTVILAVARGGIEPPTFRFSGGVLAYTNVFQLATVG